jgi:hypothetical protein
MWQLVHQDHFMGDTVFHFLLWTFFEEEQI